MSTTNSADLPISKELLEILRCPVAVQEKEKYGDDPGQLELVHNTWLVSADSGHKYPIRDGIPIMLPDEGERWKGTSVDDLPVPPPAPTPAGSSSSDTTASAVTSQSKTGGFTPKKIGLVAVALLAFILWRRR